MKLCLRRALHTDCGGGKVEKKYWHFIIVCGFIIFKHELFWRRLLPRGAPYWLWKNHLEINPTWHLVWNRWARWNGGTSWRKRRGHHFRRCCRYNRLVRPRKTYWIWFSRKNENGTPKIALLGDCKFSSDKLIVTPREGEDQLFNGEYDTITFTRTDLESASA